MNPLQIMGILKNGDPQQIAMTLIQQNFSGDPTIQNLVQYAQKGDIQSLEQFASQMFQARGLDFNTEMNNFMNMIKGA